MGEGAVWIVAVADEVVIRTALTTTDMGMAAPMANHKLRHHMSPRTPPLSLEHRILKDPSKDSEAMAPMDGHQFKITVIIILVSRVVDHLLEEVPLPRVECYQTAVALPAVVLPVAALLVAVVPGMEVLRPILKPVINRDMAVEATLVGTVAAVEGMVDRRTVVTGAMVARQAEVAMVVQEDKTTAAVTWVMETRMADRLVVAMEVATMEEVIRTLRGAEAEDSRVSYLHTTSLIFSLADTLYFRPSIYIFLCFLSDYTNKCSVYLRGRGVLSRELQ